jgi:hypothetical protein
MVSGKIPRCEWLGSSFFFCFYAYLNFISLKSIALDASSYRKAEIFLQLELAPSGELR